MKKYLNKKQTALAIVVLIALILAAVFTMSFGMSAVATAYSADFGDAEEIYYAASSSFNRETESFSYATKTVESYSINPTFPDYFNANGELENTCANVAGANIVGFYDRYYENLIPNVEPGLVYANNYIYYPMTMNASAYQVVINDLYTRMQTNVNAAGSTQTQYKNGLSSYVQSKGYNITYSSVVTNGAFDLAKAKAQLKSGNPISLFLLGYNIIKVTDDGSTVKLDKYLSDANHIEIAFGYEEVKYFNSSGVQIRSEIYLRVSTGIYGYTGVYMVNQYGSLHDAEAAHIS